MVFPGIFRNAPRSRMRTHCKEVWIMAASPYATRMLASLAGATLLLAAPAQAQSAGDGFLFGQPRVTLTARGGFDVARAGSDIFSFATERLTVQRGDFSGFNGGLDFSIRLARQVDLMLSGGYTGRVTESEFRDWVGEDDLPIEQTTRFERVPVTASVKGYLFPRGRSIGRFAWMPARVAPYVGAGGGGVWYRFRQEGEFVDFQTLDIFRDQLDSTGWAPAVLGMAGADFALTPRLALTADARYTWAKADLGVAFDQFDPIDLSGLAATLGFSIRF
jgi:opacity protein-like surface antigen